MIMIPFLPLPYKVTLELSRFLRPAAQRIAFLFPGLGMQLKQAEVDIPATSYLSIVVFSFSAFSIFFAAFFLLVGYFAASRQLLQLSPLLGIGIGILVSLQQLAYPKIIIIRKGRGVDRNLVFALRNLLIQMKSGVPMFDGINDIAKADHGELSTEFAKAVKKIATGEPPEMVFEDLSKNNPSPYLRKVLWQLSDSLKSGGDITTTLEEIVDNLTKEQSIQVKKFSSVLNPIILMYMMIAVIVPSLGVSFLVVFSSFPALNITEFTFTVLLGVITLIQFMFLGSVRSATPKLLR
ncbi:MAG: type II secretion system F family protein [DPANN group archaeon]|nr:type II secretion system F family protein [DPANN group archaeon]